MTWFIIASNRNNKALIPTGWKGEGYGNMQVAMNKFYDEGFRNFDIWESDKESVKWKVLTS